MSHRKAINDVLGETFNGRAKKNKTKAKAFCKHLTLLCFAVATAFVPVMLIVTHCDVTNVL